MPVDPQKGLIVPPDAPWAMVLRRPGQALSREPFHVGNPLPGEVRLRVEACGVCRTDLHVVDGELPPMRSPAVPGHEIVGRVDAVGEGVTWPGAGERVGVPWLGGTCHVCDYCLEGRENLCDAPELTGYTRHGGYATHVTARADYVVALPPGRPPVAMAPLLCAGLIGWRSLRRAGYGLRLGLYGFGASAHIVLQIARAQGRDIFAFTRPGDVDTQRFARSLGACWAGSSLDAPPTPLDAAIIFAPDGALVPRALGHLRKGGRLVCAGIHMSDIPSFAYRPLWHEREIVSVANLTRDDARTFFTAPECADVACTTTAYRLEQANQALDDLRHGRFEGAAVLVP
ncbi:zinc-dependent alcohol dehydrogenase family protein [Luteibacter sahnii]|uniref:zinc-dependent alcohol dehydrogenase family protein n=1 Tax=Luteibacter sahnii TaxID=3021977 RepID=UPI002A6A976E|nr:zinc-dependent alcohol dehydrogenase family protein [Luteibacter sp. PPL193]MDY1546960.1 zinc-dependent alcohol dehydrogenase family protein [Luteibacter sp. PPL193]